VIICEPVSFLGLQGKEGEADSVARSILPVKTLGLPQLQVLPGWSLSPAT
jgi:hypothetical protein